METGEALEIVFNLAHLALAANLEEATDENLDAMTTIEDFITNNFGIDYEPLELTDEEIEI